VKRPHSCDTNLDRNPAVLAVAVVAQPDPKWGESPCAFVDLGSEGSFTEEDLLSHCRARLAHFKVPRKVVFGPLPKTSTGKIQKHVLRQRARSVTAIE
jgi:fatty-acyl-CoA synthase